MCCNNEMDILLINNERIILLETLLQHIYCRITDQTLWTYDLFILYFINYASVYYSTSASCTRANEMKTALNMVNTSA